MARSRNIKPGFFTNDVLGALNPLARLLFAGMWCHADRDGRLHDRPRRLKAEILPYDACDVDRLLQDLHGAGFVLRYEVDGWKYIQCVNFEKHQNPHVKEQPSEIPAPDLSGAKLVQGTEKEKPCTEHAGLIPSSLIPDSLGTQGASAPPPESQVKPKKAKVKTADHESKVKAVTTAVWDAYAMAYHTRYLFPPVRNRKVNAQLSQFLQRIPQAEAPEVAAFYVRSQDPFYVKVGHSVGQLLMDAEKLRTQWLQWKGTPKGGAGSEWWKVAKGIEAKALELGLVHKIEEGEQFQAFSKRVREAAGPGPWNPSADKSADVLAEATRRVKAA